MLITLQTVLFLAFFPKNTWIKFNSSLSAFLGIYHRFPLSYPYFLNLTNITARILRLHPHFQIWFLNFTFIFLLYFLPTMRYDISSIASMSWVIMVGPRFVYSMSVGTYTRRSFASCFYRVIHELGALYCNVAFLACSIRL